MRAIHYNINYFATGATTTAFLAALTFLTFFTFTALAGVAAAVETLTDGTVAAWSAANTKPVDNTRAAINDNTISFFIFDSPPFFINLFTKRL